METIRATQAIRVNEGMVRIVADNQAQWASRMQFLEPVDEKKGIYKVANPLWFKRLEVVEQEGCISKTNLQHTQLADDPNGIPAVAQPAATPAPADPVEETTDGD